MGKNKMRYYRVTLYISIPGYPPERGIEFPTLAEDMISAEKNAFAAAIALGMKEYETRKIEIV
jgi:hypothetical protein